MAVFPFIFRPRPGRFGNLPEIVSVQAGTGGNTLSASGTVTVPFPTVPGRRFYLESVGIIGTQAAAGGGAITARVVKRTAGAGSDTNMTAATSLTNSIITGANTSATVAITATQPQRIVGSGDVLKVELTCASTISTQPIAQIVVQLVALD